MAADHGTPVEVDAGERTVTITSPDKVMFPERGSASTVPVLELRRNSRPLAWLRSRPLTTSPSGSVTSVPAVT